ncbi:MAG TPA: IPTL-CTERM sorting domain-containing protein [Thermoanaerobaculia bacterium]|nr:IPTL-CTERM sorting domain-containing protein [Thermoanaerobaculia bacterium]
MGGLPAALGVFTLMAGFGSRGLLAQNVVVETPALTSGGGLATSASHRLWSCLSHDPSGTAASSSFRVRVGCGAALAGGVIVTKAPTSLSAQATPSSAPVGGSIADQATLSGGDRPTGTITFNLFAPGDTGCASSIFTSTKSVSGDGTYTSDSFAALTPGTYRWIASYSGDANNLAAGPTVCSDPVQAAVVTGFTAAIPTLDPRGLALLVLLLAAAGLLIARRAPLPPR